MYNSMSISINFVWYKQPLVEQYYYTLCNMLQEHKNIDKNSEVNITLWTI